MRAFAMCPLRGPSAGWGPVRVGAHMGPYGPMWAHMGPYGSSWTGLGEGVNFPSTFRRDIWTNLVRLGSKTHFFMQFLDDSASLWLEKLKNHVVLTKNLIFDLKSNKYHKKIKKIQKQMIKKQRNSCEN